MELPARAETKLMHLDVAAIADKALENVDILLDV